MLSADEIRQKIASLEAEADRLGEPDGAAYREMAMEWRRMQVEAVVTDVMRKSLADEEPEE